MENNIIHSLVKSIGDLQELKTLIMNEGDLYHIQVIRDDLSEMITELNTYIKQAANDKVIVSDSDRRLLENLFVWN